MQRKQFLKGKVAIVTGGGRGIGAAAALALAEAGASVTVAARTSQEIEGIAGRIKKSAGRALAVKTDVSREKDVSRMVQQTLDTFSRIDFLVNVAGVVHPMGKPTWEADPQEWRRCIEANLLGVFLTNHAVLPHMLEQSSGRVLNMSSPAAEQAIERASAYCASKAGVNHFTRVLASELKGSGVTANAFNPGPMDTPTLTEVYETLYPETPAWYLKTIKRDPAQAVSLVLWLCSPATAQMSGEFVVWKDPYVQRRVARFLSLAR